MEVVQRLLRPLRLLELPFNPLFDFPQSVRGQVTEGVNEIFEGQVNFDVFINIIEVCKNKGTLYSLSCAYLKKPRIRSLSWAVIAMQTASATSSMWSGMKLASWPYLV